MTANIENDLIVSEYYRMMLHTFYNISKINESVTIMQGYCMGGGGGLAMSCKYRVATYNTKFAMPENKIGLAPDVGASYFLSHLPNKAVGLYLMVTGKTISGIDCYWAKIATHYVPDSKITELYFKLMRSKNFKKSLDKFAIEPYAMESELLKNLKEIEEYFGNVQSAESLLKKLASSKTKFAKETLKIISKLCPLSVKVAVKSFNLGINKTYKQCLEQDYNIEVQMCFRRSYNYTTAIKRQFIIKIKGEDRWYPSAIDHVTDEMVDAIIENQEGPVLGFDD